MTEYEELLKQMLAQEDYSWEKRCLVEQSRILDIIQNAGNIYSDPVGLELLCDLLSLDPTKNIAAQAAEYEAELSKKIESYFEKREEPWLTDEMRLEENKLQARAQELRDQLMEEVLRSDSKEILWLLGIDHLAEVAVAASEYADIPMSIWRAIAACDQIGGYPPRSGKEQYIAAMSYLEYFVKEAEKHFGEGTPKGALEEMTEEEPKFLKPGDGKGPSTSATFAVFDRKAAARDIIDFWKDELAKAAAKEAAEKKE